MKYLNGNKITRSFCEEKLLLSKLSMSYYWELDNKVGKLDIDKSVNVPTSLNNLKTKVDNLDANPNATTLIQTNKCIIVKLNLEKNLLMLIKNTSC